MEFLGWYTIGGDPTKDDVDFHEQVVLELMKYPVIACLCVL